MAAPSHIATVSGSEVNADDLTLDISSTGFEAGDLAIALVAFGDTDGSGGVPAGWLRVTGEVIAEDVELEGELLYRFLVEGDTTFAFTGADTGAIAGSISIYRGVDTLNAIDAQAQTVISVGSTNHLAPTITTTIADTTVLAIGFLWYAHTGASNTEGNNERVDLSVTAGGAAPDRSLGIALYDEAVAGIGATGTRELVTAESGLANTLLLALTPDDEALTTFDREYGITQGRIQPTNDFPVSDSFAYVLGSDLAKLVGTLEIGDYVQISQTADITTETTFEVTVRLRGGEFELPEGVRWEFSLLLDGVKEATHLIEDGRTRDLVMGINLAASGAGTYKISLRLELVAA